MAVGLLGTAASGLQAFQRAISVAGHNISNANTEGYTRQRIELGTRPPTFNGAGYIGNGVSIEGIQRVFDEFANQRLLSSTSSSAQYDALALFAGRVSDLLGDEDAGVSAGLETFFNAVQTVADDPSSIPARQLLLAEGDSLVTRFHDLNAQLYSFRNEINSGINNMVTEVNDLSTAIAEVNRSIVDASDLSSGRTPNDLLDKRDQLINRLAEIVSVRTVPQDNGALNVFIGSGQSLVTGFLPSQLQAVPNSFDNRRLDIAISSGATSAVITDAVNGGELGATLDFRDQILNPAQNSLGRVAISLATEFNTQHSLGMDLNGAAGSAFFAVAAPGVAANGANTGSATVTVNLDTANISNLTTQDYQLGFDGAVWTLSDAYSGQPVTMSGSGTAADPFIVDGLSIEVAGGAAAGDRFLIQPTRSGSAGIASQINDPREVAAAAMAGGAAPGDNSNALLLAGLQTALTMEGGSTSFQGAYGQLIAELGTQTRSAQITADAQGALLQQAQASRDAVSGVNLDEEAANLLRFQQAYQAVAQVISVADSTFQTLLSAVRR